MGSRRSSLLIVALMAASIVVPLAGPAGADHDGTPLCEGEHATIVGTNGNDILLGTDGPDVIFAGGGSDNIQAGGGDDIICGGPGVDSIDAGPGNDILVGGDSVDFLFGQDGVDKLFGGGGDDLLFGGDGRDKLKGGDGDDELDGGPGKDKLFGQAGDDLLLGGDNGDTLKGGGGDDVLRGGGGNDVLKGQGGDDLIVGQGGGKDKAVGGSGVDECDAEKERRCEPKLGTPDVVGVVDRDTATWFLVEPILADLTPDAVPGGDPKGSGRAQLTFGDGVICFGLDIFGLKKVTDVNIRQGAVGNDGPVVVDLDFATNGSHGCVEEIDALIDQILADLESHYVKVHTEDFPQGAVRGQLSGGPIEPFSWGEPGDVPLFGDWDGDGTATPGSLDLITGKGSASNDLRGSTLDFTFTITVTASDMVPVVGDWDGDDTDGIGLIDPGLNGVFYLDLVTSGVFGPPDIEFGLTGIGKGALPIAGDFDHDGVDELGVFDEGVFFWRNTLTTGPANQGGLVLGGADDQGLFGDWDGDGLERPGFFDGRRIFLGDLGPNMEIFTDGFESGNISVWGPINRD